MRGELFTWRFLALLDDEDDDKVDEIGLTDDGDCDVEDTRLVDEDTWLLPPDDVTLLLHSDAATREDEGVKAEPKLELLTAWRGFIALVWGFVVAAGAISSPGFTLLILLLICLLLCFISCVL